LNGLEKRDIYDLTKKLIADRNKSDPEATGKYAQQIKETLFDYMEDSDHIILDGFVTFRLGSYVGEVEQLVDMAVDEFIVQKEYGEFVQLLRYFVEMQDTVYNTVHVCVRKDKTYAILDEDFRDITQECAEDFFEGLQAGLINHDDVLISSLISLAPKKLHLHNMEFIENEQLINTIKNIFITRLSICKGCNMCRPDENQRK
jgi:putative sporulation protein YtxC